MSKPKHILVIRFSAMGDVALTIPALLSVAKSHPSLTFTVITRPFFARFFPEHPQIKALGIELDEYAGFFGLKNLVNELQATHSFDGVVDLHNVLRSKIITSFFKRKGIERVTLDKLRGEKKLILSGKSENRLPHVIHQYLNTFKNAGYKSDLIEGPWLDPQPTSELRDFLNSNHLQVKKEKWVGIAPFAAHEAKIWGITNTQNLIEILTSKGYKVFLFGGGQIEVDILTQLHSTSKGVYSVAGAISFMQELALMKQLDSLVCMDSSNMHFGCMLGIKVVSIWGATTPLLGFYPFGNEDYIVEVPQKDKKLLTLSRYGDKHAKNGYNWQDHISMDEIVNHIG